MTALESMRRFQRLTGQHYPIGTQHTGIFLAQLLIEARKHREALQLITDIRRDEPDFGGAIYAQLLSLHGKHVEAESVLLPLIQKYPKESSLYGMLANVRLAAGRDIEAMRALEASLEATHCAPGQCGYRPPNVAIIRSLATLYFERDMELDRAHELAEQAASLVQKPMWEDLYLAGLAGRQRRDTRVEPAIQALWAQTQGGPRSQRLEKHLPLLAS